MYATGFQIAQTEGGITIILQRLRYAFKGGETLAKPEVIGAVTMSPLIANDLKNVLGEVLGDFEKQHGVAVPNIGRFKAN